jgi:hypothetical protein
MVTTKDQKLMFSKRQGAKDYLTKLADETTLLENA